MRYLIKDWAGNILDFRGRFMLPQFAVPMEFQTFDDGWDWICTNIDDETKHEDLYVLEIGVLK